MTRAIKSKPVDCSTLTESQSMNGELQLQDLTFEMTTLDGAPGFRTCPGKGFISSRQLMDVIDNGSQYLDIGLDYRISTLRILQMVLDCLDKLSVSMTSIRRGKKHKCYLKPPKPFNAYMHFNKTIRKKISTLMPEYKQKEVSKLTGAIWKASSTSTKAYHRYAAARENKLNYFIARYKDRFCPQSLHFYRRTGSFVCTCNGSWCLSKLKGNIAEVLELQWVSNVDPHVFRSIADTSSRGGLTISRNTSYSNSSACSINEEEWSNGLLSWLDSWDSTECSDIASDFVDWSSILTDLSIYVGRIQDHYKLQLLDSIMPSGNDVNHAFKSPSADMDLWVPSIQAGEKLEDF